MADDLQEWTNDFLRMRPPETHPLRAARAAVLGEAPEQRFSPFVSEQVDRAIALANRFMELAHAQPGRAGLDAVRAAAEEAAASEPLDLVRYALMVFITHDPRGSRLRIPALEERAPEKVLPSAQPAEAAVLRAAAPQPQESDLNWFREDAWANDHHDHWHIVYPAGGVPDGAGNAAIKKRVGELFFYMHQQMLARYDTERIAAGLPRVRPLSDYAERIPEAYDPRPDLDLQNNPNSPASVYSPRLAGLRLANMDRDDIGTYPVQELKGTGDRIAAAVDRGVFQQGARTAPVTADLLGATVEPTGDSFSRALFGNHHGMGHVLLAVINDPRGSAPPGVMLYTEAAIRDPVFYRWHKHVDDISFRWQERQPPNDFSDAPGVLIRKGPGGAAPENQSPDIILCFKNKIPGARRRDFDGQAYGEATFGGQNWDTAFASGGATTGELQTMMLERTIMLSDGRPATIPYLDQREFVYFLRVENRRAEATRVTVRIFLAAAEAADDRRMWIEMDKFKYTLAPSQRAVIFRPANRASVIRKPGVKPPRPVKRRRSGDPDDPENYCNCGWPYNLLLPRGRREGMPFRLLVMLTDGDIDQVAEDRTCGSMSFCGVKNRDYPDTRAMGYPFDRPFPAGRSIAQTIAAQPNMAARDITIRWVDPPRR